MKLDNGKIITTNISVHSPEQIDINILNKYFKNDNDKNFNVKTNEFDDEFVTMICNSTISKESISNLVFDIAKSNKDFEVFIDSDERYYYESFKYQKDGEDICHKTIPDNCCNDGINHLVDVVFHPNVEKISIKKP